MSEQDFDWLEVDDHGVADLLHAGLMATAKGPIDRAGILAQRIPRDAAALAEWRKQMTAYRTTDHKDAVERTVDQLDNIVGPALGLNEMDQAQIKREMAEDAFLRNIIPRYPSTSTRLHGFRTGLDSARRYSGGTDEVREPDESV